MRGTKFAHSDRSSNGASSYPMQVRCHRHSRAAPRRPTDSMHASKQRARMHTHISGFKDSMVYELEAGDPTIDEMLLFFKPVIICDYNEYVTKPNML